VCVPPRPQPSVSTYPARQDNEGRDRKTGLSAVGQPQGRKLDHTTHPRAVFCLAFHCNMQALPLESWMAISAVVCCCFLALPCAVQDAVLTQSLLSKIPKLAENFKVAYSPAHCRVLSCVKQFFPVRGSAELSSVIIVTALHEAAATWGDVCGFQRPWPGFVLGKMPRPRKLGRHEW
jgi:hypothetical protein